ncbi:MAG: hypothetical protein MI919_24410, partial [Holophagales bacterium]|nr:hypothetical protein [Holophagales bacterium]
MNPATWQRIGSIVESAAELEGEARRRWLDERCGEDPALRRAAESFLAAVDAGGSFLDDASWAPGPPPGEPAPRLEPGEPIGGYRVVRQLGHGGMGSVYLAERIDRSFDRPVAVKVARSRSADTELLWRFRRETFILG